MRIFTAILLFIFIPVISYAGIFSKQKEVKSFQTKGVASLMSAEGIFTYSVKEKDIAIPTYINLHSDARWQGLTYDPYDTKSGWTICRLPMKGGKKLVFNCRPTSFYE